MMRKAIAATNLNLSMLLIVLMIVLLISNWFFSDAFVFYPLHFLKWVGSLGGWGLLLLGFALFSWGFRD